MFIVLEGLDGSGITTQAGLLKNYFADRAHHLDKEIEPALKDGKIVISDRYILSTYAFGSVDVSLEIIKKINSTFRKPDLTFFVDTQPEICMERIGKSRQHIELFEEIGKLKKIRENYLSLLREFPNSHIVNGNRKMEEIHKEIVAIIEISP